MAMTMTELSVMILLMIILVDTKCTSLVQAIYQISCIFRVLLTYAQARCSAVWNWIECRIYHGACSQGVNPPSFEISCGGLLAPWR